MGLTADTPDFFYESRETRREREASANVSHRVGADGAVRTRLHAASSASGASGRSASRRSAACSKPRPRKSPATRSAACESPCPPSSKGDGRSVTPDQKPIADPAICYELPPRITREKCVKPAPWQTGHYKRDICGSGIVPVRLSFLPSRKKLWCKTPLSMYQATIGELGRAILCREKIVPRDVKPGPPCNVEAFILPPCRGYYRKYDCLRPCEEMYAYQKAGQKIYRNEVERYWEPCTTREQNGRGNINEFAGQNVYLGKQLRRRNEDIPCW